MKKWMIRGIGVVLLLLLLGAVGTYLYLNSIVQAAIEHSATEATGVRTTVHRVDVQPFAGKMGIWQLELANPPGFSGSPFLQLGQGEMHLSVSSLMDQTVEVQELSLNRLHLHLIYHGGRSNYQIILKHVRQQADHVSGGKRFIIHQLDVKHVAVTLTGFAGPTRTIKLPPIHETNLGDAHGAHGSRLPNLTDAVMASFFHSLAQHPDVLSKAMASVASGSLKSLSGLGKAGASFFAHTAQIFDGGAGGAATQSAKQATRGLSHVPRADDHKLTQPGKTAGR